MSVDFGLGNGKAYTTARENPKVAITTIKFPCICGKEHEIEHAKRLADTGEAYGGMTCVGCSCGRSPNISSRATVTKGVLIETVVTVRIEGQPRKQTQPRKKVKK